MVLVLVWVWVRLVGSSTHSESAGWRQRHKNKLHAHVSHILTVPVIHQTWYISHTPQVTLLFGQSVPVPKDLGLAKAQLVPNDDVGSMTPYINY